MSRHTSFRIGGPARLMALPKSPAQAKAAVLAAREADILPFFLGNGSNLLVPDEGVERFLIQPAGRYAADPLNRVWEENGQLCAGGGVSLAVLANAAQGRALTGLEFASGIPGAGDGVNLKIMAAVIIGGTSPSGGSGTIVGTAIGCILLATITNFLILVGIPSTAQTLIFGLILILSMFIDKYRRAVLSGK